MGNAKTFLVGIDSDEHDYMDEEKDLGKISEENKLKAEQKKFEEAKLEFLKLMEAMDIKFKESFVDRDHDQESDKVVNRASNIHYPFRRKNKKNLNKYPEMCWRNDNCYDLRICKKCIRMFGLRTNRMASKPLDNAKLFDEIDYEENEYE